MFGGASLGGDAPSVDWSNGIERSIASHQNAAVRCLGASELPATVAVGTAPMPFHLSFPFHLLRVSYSATLHNAQ